MESCDIFHYATGVRNWELHHYNNGCSRLTMRIIEIFLILWLRAYHMSQARKWIRSGAHRPRMPITLTKKPP